jgi:hypothetical protein
MNKIFQAYLLTLALIMYSCKTEKLSLKQSSTHFNYYLSFNDYVDTAWQEKYYSWLTSKLGLQNTDKLSYFKYRDRKQLKKITGRKTNGFAEPGTYNFHTIWKTDNHESIHTVVFNHWGYPPALFTEGIAVAHHVNPSKSSFVPLWNGVPIDDIARSFKEVGKIPPLERLIESSSFRKFDEQVAYPVAGSFIAFLLSKHGLIKLRTFFSKTEYKSSASDTFQIFYNTFGITLDAAWKIWLNSLE